VPLNKPLSQQSDNEEKALATALAGYRAQLENLWATFTYKEPNLLNINQLTVNGFIGELSGIMGGVIERRSIPSIHNYLKSVNAIVDKIRGARDELTLVWNSFGMTNTDKNIASRIYHYNQCQKFLEEAIKQFR
jgi:hypothetical protein